MDESYLSAKGTISKSRAYSVRGDIEQLRWLKTTPAGRGFSILDTQETPSELVTETAKNASFWCQHVDPSSGVVGRHVRTPQRGRVGTEGR